MKNVLIFSGRPVPKIRIYKRVIEATGLSAVLITPRPFNTDMQRRLKKASGIVLSGGSDIDPEFYAPGEPIHPSVYGIDTERDILEREVTRYAVEHDIPVLAICRGIQVLNWACGGGLWQDIDAMVPPEGTPKLHSQHNRGIPRWITTHEVSLEPGSLIHSIFKKDRIKVNSTHHQAVKTPAPGFTITAHAHDGVIEALEKPDARFILGVQFHPERMWQRELFIGALFHAFARAVEK